MLILFHILLALVLFFLQNWLGGRTYSFGYIRFSLLDEKDEAHSLNFVLKVFGPIVFLIVVVALLQYFGCHDLTKNIIQVIYFYLAIRIMVIFLYQRQRIVNWLRVSSYYFMIILISYIIYDKLINEVGELLPDFSQLKNEIWLLILIFIYQIGNGSVAVYPENEEKERSRAYLPEMKNRKRKYILRMHDKFQDKYGSLISKKTANDEQAQLVIYAILIFENFNRPPFVRWLERIWVKMPWTSQVSQGIMQVKSAIKISDEDSLKMGVSSFMGVYNAERSNDYWAFRRTIKNHCPDRKYVRQVLFIAKAIIEHYEDQDKYENIYNEIRSEFDLY